MERHATRKTVSTQLNSTQLNSTQLNSTQLNSTQLNSTRKMTEQISEIKDYGDNYLKKMQSY